MSTIEIAYRSRLTGRTPFDYVWTRNIGVQNTFKMICQEDSKMRALLKRCRNNGILEYWNDDILLKNPIFQFSRRSQPVPSRICGAAKAGKATLAKSAIPSFHFSKGASVRKAFSYDNSRPPGKLFLDRCEPGSNITFHENR